MKNNVGEIMENRNNHKVSQFPDGMRVLVVDDSRVCLKYVTLLLQKCRFKVTAMENSNEALKLLKQNEDNFDIVLTNVHMHEVDGFKLLEAGLEHDIPVIMISANDDLEIIKKGVRHGAVDYFVKPVSLGEIKNIWQHVYRKNLCVNYETPTNKDADQWRTQDLKDKITERVNARTLPEGAPKRGRVKTLNDIGDDMDMEPVSKKERIRWSPALHTKFVDSVAKLGGVDKAVPKKILEMMGEKDITREKVASHLQKYRKAIKDNYMAIRDGDGGKKVRKNNNINNNNSRCHVVGSGTLCETLNGGSGPTFDRRHPTVPSIAPGGAVTSPLPPRYTIHQRQHFPPNGWMLSNTLSQSSQVHQVRPTHNLVHQLHPNVPFDRTSLGPNDLATTVNHPSHSHQVVHPQHLHMPFDGTTMSPNDLAMVNHSSHPHQLVHQQASHPYIGNVRSYYLDPHQHQMAYENVRSVQEYDEMLLADFPGGSGNGSLLDIVLANESFLYD